MTFQKDIADTEMYSAVRSGSTAQVDEAFPAWKALAVRGASSFVPTRAAFWVSREMLDHVLGLRCFEIEQKKKMPYIWSALSDQRHPEAGFEKYICHAARQLISAGVSPNDFSGYGARHRGEHPIVTALRYNDVVSTQILLDAGLDFDVFGGVAHIREQALLASAYYSIAHHEALALLSAHELRDELSQIVSAPSAPSRKAKM